MRTDNALIIGAKTPTDANGTVNRVCPGGYTDVIREGECRGDKIFISSLLKAEDDLDEIVDYCVEKNAKVIVCAGDDLYRRSGSARTSFARNVPSQNRSA